MDILHPSLELGTIIATIFYSLVGVTLMIICVVIVDRLFKLDLHKELVEDENVAFGILFAGIAIGVAVIIAAAIIG